MEQKRNTHIRKSRYSPKVTDEHTVASRDDRETETEEESV